MASFQKSKSNTENEAVLRLMSHVENDPAISQRKLAADIGVAMGLVNTYLKRCINKGWIKAKQVPAKRLAYYITPKGFVEKSRLTAEYLSNSLDFFRLAKAQCSEIIINCKDEGINKIALVGEGELADIACLVASSVGVDTVRVHVDDKLNKFAAIVITDINNPQQAFDFIIKNASQDKVFIPALLHVSRFKNFSANGEKE